MKARVCDESRKFKMGSDFARAARSDRKLPQGGGAGGPLTAGDGNLPSGDPRLQPKRSLLRNRKFHNSCECEEIRNRGLMMKSRLQSSIAALSHSFASVPDM